MIKLFEKTSVVIESEPVKVPIAILPKPTMEEVELEEYVKVAKDLGMDLGDGEIFEARLKSFLAKENIRIYEADKVAKYLKEKLPEGWEFHGFRMQDVEKLKNYTWTIGEDTIHFRNRVYSDAIPFPILLTIQKVLAELPEACFFITAPIAKGDPFLCVTGTHSRLLFIERWDEPSFRG